MLQRWSAWLPWALAGCVATAGVVVALQPEAWQVRHLLPDDAYYYFQIARNAAAGHGASLDGINVTNGYHPLWMAFLVSLHSALPAAAAVPAALVVSALAGGATLLLLSSLLKRLGVSAGGRTAALALLAFNPWLLTMWVNGLETSIAAATLVATWLACVAWTQSDRRGWWAWPLILAGLGGLATLGRTDHLILVAPPLLAAWWVARRSWRSLLAMAVAGLAVLAPWLIWNLLVIGSFEQTSGSAFAHTTHQLLYLTNDPASPVTWLKGAAIGLYGEAKTLWVALAAPGVYIGAFGLALAAFLRAQREHRAAAAVPVAVAAAVGILTLLLIHGAVRWSFRPWYAVPPVLALAAAVAYLGHLGGIELRNVPRWARASAVALAVAAFGLAVPSALGQYQLQGTMQGAAAWMSAELPSDARVGVFNAGIPAYFSGRQVVNLDGLVNNGAAAALEQRQLWAYVRASGLTHLADFGVNFDYRQSWAWGEPSWRDQVELVHELPAPGGRGSYRIYRVLPAS